MFFLNAGAGDIVAFSQASIVVDKIFRHQENGDSPGSRRVSFDTRQDRMDNIFRQIMLAVGDKDFIARESECPIIIFHRCGGKRADIGSGFGFGQQHGAAPLRRCQFCEVFLFLLLTAV